MSIWAARWQLYADLDLDATEGWGLKYVVTVVGLGMMITVGRSASSATSPSLKADPSLLQLPLHGTLGRSRINYRGLLVGRAG